MFDDYETKAERRRGEGKKAEEREGKGEEEEKDEDEGGGEDEGDEESSGIRIRRDAIFMHLYPEKFIEVLVVADFSMLQFYGPHEIHIYLLTMMHIVVPVGSMINEDKCNVGA